MGLFEYVTPTHDTGDGSAGTSGAASIDAEISTTATVYYDVGASSDDIKIEASTDESSWRELPETVASGDVTTGGDTVDVTDLGYQFIRVYAGSSFSDSDVNTIEISAKGT